MRKRLWVRRYIHWRKVEYEAEPLGMLVTLVVLDLA